MHLRVAEPTISRSTRGEISGLLARLGLQDAHLDRQAREGSNL